MTWLPWNPTVEPSREECEALIGRRVRVGEREWSTLIIQRVRLRHAPVHGGGEIMAHGEGQPVVLWPPSQIADGTEIEAKEPLPWSPMAAGVYDGWTPPR